jgi:monoamine oxidase
LVETYSHNTGWKIKSIEINDWYSKPNLHVYLWKAGLNCVPVINHLANVSINNGNTRKIHICGEAFSEYQCFMEGALRSVENVVKDMIGKNHSLENARNSIDKILYYFR